MRHKSPGAGANSHRDSGVRARSEKLIELGYFPVKFSVNVEGAQVKQSMLKGLFRPGARRNFVDAL
jgi:hypothetical protein